MALTKEQNDATRSALAGCKRVGLYTGQNLSVSAFRKKLCTDLVEACGATCPLNPPDYNTELITFREKVREKLKDKGYAPLLMLQLVCAQNQAEDGTLTPWTWADWCDHLANRL